MKILPSDYTINRYGLYARFVEESDAQFILDIRTNEHAKYMNDVSNDLEKQIQWIREYKEREKQGKDYYFIFYKDNKPCGLNRIYDFRGEVFSTGSWAFTQDAPFGAAFLASVICREIAFYELGLDREEVDLGVHVDNTSVMKFDFSIGMKEIGRVMTEKGEYISLGITRLDFEKGKKRILRMFRYDDVYANQINK